MAEADRTPRRASAELKRLEESREWNSPWRIWGPYVSERQWGTVREDYSQDGNAWDYFTHDHARSRAYHWGEDGLAGFCDVKQRLCFALALWNGKDPILKERLFGLSNGEGNHGEDVKEYYFYLDSTPTHSYMKWLYKYPQAAFPYDDLVKTNARRTRQEFEYELIDTGVFDEDRYFDVFVEYAKSSPEECFIRITVDEPRPGDSDDSSVANPVVPQHVELVARPRNPVWRRRRAPAARAQWRPRTRNLAIDGSTAMERRRCCSPRTTRIPSGSSTRPTRAPTSRTPSTRSSSHGKTGAVNPAEAGTKAAAHYQLEVGSRPIGGGAALPHRCARRRPVRSPPSTRRSRPGVARPTSSTDRARRTRPARTARRSCDRPSAASSGPSSTYFFDINMWLREHGVNPFDVPLSDSTRNRQWFHMRNDDIISMPDKWEYPWYAAWDLAFHAVALTRVDPDFAKHQLNLMLKPRYQHANGQVPAYEWNFGDVNPPVHAWATLYQFRIEQAMRGKGDVEFLKRAFGKLLVNFTWWVNRKDRLGKSVFEGGFLGLDNIGIFDRSAELPTGGHLEQADGTAWMAMYCQNMFEIAIELAAHDPSYDDLAHKFAEHFLWIAAALNKVGHDGMWDEADGFYYDVLRLPDGSAARLKVRSLVGLLPLCATTVIEPRQRAHLPQIGEWLQKRFSHIPELLAGIHPVGPEHTGCGGRTIAALVDSGRLRRILSRMLDEREFLGPYGIRSVSRSHEQDPYVVRVGGQGVPGLLSAGRVRQRDVRRELQLARPRVVPDEHPPDSRAARVLCLLRRCLQSGVPHRLRQADDALRGGQRESPIACSASSCAMRPAGVRCSAARKNSRRTRTGAIAFRSMSTSTATTAPAWAPATRPGGPPWSLGWRSSSAPLMPARYSSPAGRRSHRTSGGSRPRRRYWAAVTRAS